MHELDPQRRAVEVTARPEEGEAERPIFYIHLSKPYVARALIVINLLVFAAVLVFEFFQFGTFFGPRHVQVLYLFGMKSNQDILLHGEEWRLFTAMFLHIGPTHLISNTIGLLMLGPIIEGHFGHWRFAAIYVLGGLLGSIASYAFSPALSAGASGAIFGLLGATLIYFYRFRENFGRQGRDILQAMFVVLVLNLFVGLSAANVDNWGHVGGLVGGIIVTIGLMPRYRVPQVILSGRQALVREPRLGIEIAWIILCIALLLGAFWAAHQITPV
jgi:rhomboid protease GluP